MTTDNNALPRQKITIDGVERDVLPVDTLLNHRYKIKRVLGHGNMGAVYLAIDKNLGARVAVKENLFLTEAGRQDFENEAKLLFRLKNDHLPRVFDYFQADGRQYLVMDFIEGQDLYQLIRPDAAKPAAPLPPAQARQYLIEVCAAVEYLHRQQPPIIHRDIKPQNIKVTPTGEVFLVDFGLAKEGPGSGGQGLTFGFAPPEQYTGRTTVTPAADIYALGATLYAAVTGQRPPDSLQRVSGEAGLTPAHQVNPAVSPALSEAIAQAMRLNATERPASVAAWRAQLQAIPTEIPQSTEQEQETEMPATTDLPEKAPQGQAVFISYSRKDETFIKQLYGVLTSRGLSAWYDRFDIPVGSQWATEIVEGIKNCRVFLLVLSPDSAASPNVRKEVDLAQRYNKQIVPLIWRATDIPVAMEYQLAGIQWMEFKEDASADKFSQLAAVLNRLLGGATMTEAAGAAAIARESTIPPVVEATPKADGGPRLGGLKKKQTVSPLSLGGSVISGWWLRLGWTAPTRILSTPN
jgi:serine/threonine-protein kinase